MIHQLEEKQRIFLKRDAGIRGIKRGTEGTIEYVGSMSTIYPIQVRFDVPDEDGHYIHRLKLNEIGLIQLTQEPLGVVLP